MKLELEKLNQEVGVKGSMVVTSDGIVVASELHGGLREEAVAAMASSIIRQIAASLEDLELGKFVRFILTSEYGKMVFVDAGVAYLVVLADMTINLDITLLEIYGAAHRIRSRSQMAL